MGYQIFPKENKAIIKGVNIVKKHQKPTKQSGGGITEKELPINLSNLAYISVKDGKKQKLVINLKIIKK